VRTGLASEYAETRRALPRPTQGPLLGTRDALSGDQEASHQAQEEAEQDHQSHLSDSPIGTKRRDLGDGQLGTPAGLNHKLRACFTTA
jgi:hypothetical protein